MAVCTYTVGIVKLDNDNNHNIILVGWFRYVLTKCKQVLNQSCVPVFLYLTKQVDKRSNL